MIVWWFNGDSDVVVVETKSEAEGEEEKWYKFLFSFVSILYIGVWTNYRFFPSFNTLILLKSIIGLGHYELDLVKILAPLSNVKKGNVKYIYLKEFVGYYNNIIQCEITYLNQNSTNSKVCNIVESWLQ